MTLPAVQPSDLFGAPLLPPEGVHFVRVLRLEYIHSPSLGGMRRLVAEIVRGPYAGCLVFKPLSIDLRGLAWIEQTAIASGVDLRAVPASIGQRLDHLAAALARVGDLRAVIYHYRHPEAVFPTIKSLARVEA